VSFNHPRKTCIAKAMFLCRSWASCWTRFWFQVASHIVPVLGTQYCIHAVIRQSGWTRCGTITASQKSKIVHNYYVIVMLIHLFTARCYAERGYATVSRLSVCPSVTLRYDFHIGWNSSKITSRPNSLRPLLWLTPTWAIWCNGNMGKIRGA